VGTSSTASDAESARALSSTMRPGIAFVVASRIRSHCARHKRYGTYEQRYSGSISVTRHLGGGTDKRRRQYAQARRFCKETV
jgi:hypothetical protein